MSATTKAIVTLAGAAVLAAGLIMLVTPGPGLVAIVAGLAILATEWEWAERWLEAARRKLAAARDAAVEMDPAVRRRRIAVVGGAGVAGLGAVSAYVALRDWPTWSVGAWDKVQAVAGFVPELPGM